MGTPYVKPPTAAKDVTTAGYPAPVEVQAYDATVATEVPLRAYFDQYPVSEFTAGCMNAGGRNMSARAKVTTGYTPWFGSSTNDARTNNENIRDLKSSLSIDFDPPTFTSGVAEIWGCNFSPSLDIAGAPGTLGSYWATGVN